MEYVDEYNNVHIVKKELDRGGQGVIFITKDNDVLIKEGLKNNEIINDKKEIEKFHININNIIFKPIPFDIQIARPIALLKNKAGYVMKFLSNLKPVKELVPTEQQPDILNKVPDFLSQVPDERFKQILSYYFATGSVRKRLLVLYKTAEVLYRLHLRGLVYFDISPNNIFFNDEVVYLIDIDNLKYNSSIKSYDAIYTSNYEVPEVVNGIEPNSFYSDIYAFGILAYFLLTTQNPFDGDSKEESNWDDESETKNRWDLPWIEDSNDDSNSTNAGLRGVLTISDELDRLLHTLFEEGKNDKHKRPSLNLWIKALASSYYKTIECPNCKATYYDDKFNECPYCKNLKPKRLIIKSYLYKDDKKLEISSYYFAKELNIKEINLPAFLFCEFSLDSFAKVKIDKTKLEFIFEDSKEMYIDNKKIFRMRKKFGYSTLKKGIFVVVKDKIERYIEIKVEE